MKPADYWLATGRKGENVLRRVKSDYRCRMFVLGINAVTLVLGEMWNVPYSFDWLVISGASMDFHHRYTLSKALTWVWERTLKNKGVESSLATGWSRAARESRIISFQLCPGNFSLWNLRRRLWGVCKSFQLSYSDLVYFAAPMPWAVRVSSRMDFRGGRRQVESICFSIWHKNITDW